MQEFLQLRLGALTPVPQQADFKAILAVGPKLMADSFTKRDVQLLQQTADDLADMILNKLEYEKAMARMAMEVGKRKQNN